LTCAKLLRALAAATLGSLFAVAVPSLAGAVTGDPNSRALSVGMFVGGIDENQAAKVGNIVRLVGRDKVLFDGRTGAELGRVPADPDVARERAIRASEKTAPFNEVPGNCGRSHMYLRDVSQNDIYQFKTGFNVVSNAYDFDWKINISASTGSGRYNFDWEDTGPMFPDEDWTSGWKNDDTPLNGWHRARVTYGVAFLTNGNVCYSGYPHDSVFVS
jgi:hypothetical protein